MGSNQWRLNVSVRGKPHRTTVPDKKAPCPLDKVNRQFRVPAPNMLWVSDFTYFVTRRGFAYVAFVIDACARRIVGWRVSTSAHAGFVLDALDQAVHQRRPTKGMGLVRHSDRGSQYMSIRYTERLAEAGIEPSVGSVGDSYDNALAATINGLFKVEVIHLRGPWRSFEAVEYATLEWVDWFNNRRLLEPIGNIQPAEAEANFYAALETEPTAAELTRSSLRQTRRGSLNRLPPTKSGGGQDALLQATRRTRHVPRLRQAGRQSSGHGSLPEPLHRSRNTPRNSQARSVQGQGKTGGQPIFATKPQRCFVDLIEFRISELGVRDTQVANRLQRNLLPDPP